MKKFYQKNCGQEWALVGTVGALLFLLFSLAACGDNTATTPTSNPSSDSTTNAAAIPGDGGAAAATGKVGVVSKPLGGFSSANSNSSGDPFASYSASQVMTAFIQAYQQGDWNTCSGLIADEVRVGWSSPDQFQLDIEALNKQKGPIHIINYGLSSDQGSLQYYTVIYYRSKDPQATVPPVNQQSAADFLIKRINNTWKIDQYEEI